MKRALYIILCLLALSACEKTFDIERQMKGGMTYMKFVPSNEDDTTFFFVQATTPLKDGMNPARTVGETVSVTVNGTPVTLVKDQKKSVSDMSQIYWTRHVFKAGDEIVAEASVPGREPARAVATIPGEAPEFEWTARIEGQKDAYDRQLCFDIEYVNRPGYTGHYGVAVRYERTSVKQTFRIYRDNPDVIEWDNPETIVDSGDEYPSSAFDMSLTSLGQEPLVLNPGSLNRDYRWSHNYVDGIYYDIGYGVKNNNVLSWIDIPENDPQTSRQQIRVHYHGNGEDIESGIPENYWEWEWAGDVFEGLKIHSEYRYKLLFYNYDENSFNYLKARENESNDLALFGLAPASFTFTNVMGGMGVCGSYMVSETDWFTIGE